MLKGIQFIIVALVFEYFMLLLMSTFLSTLPLYFPNSMGIICFFVQILDVQWRPFFPRSLFWLKPAPFCIPRKFTLFFSANVPKSFRTFCFSNVVYFPCQLTTRNINKLLHVKPYKNVENTVQRIQTLAAGKHEHLQ